MERNKKYMPDFCSLCIHSFVTKYEDPEEGTKANIYCKKQDRIIYENMLFHYCCAGPQSTHNLDHSPENCPLKQK